MGAEEDVAGAEDVGSVACWEGVGTTTSVGDKGTSALGFGWWMGDSNTSVLAGSTIV